MTLGEEEKNRRREEVKGTVKKLQVDSVLGKQGSPLVRREERGSIGKLIT